MPLLRCLKCYAKYPEADACPHCGTPAGALGGETRPPRRTLIRTPDFPDPDPWAGMWIFRCVLLLLVGFITPVYIDRSRVLWFWDLLQRDRALMLATLLPVLLAFACLGIGFLTRGIPRAAGIFGISVGAFVLYAVLARVDRAFSSPAGAARGLSTLVQAIQVPLAAAAIAVGNRLRKRHPSHPLPRYLTGLGGLVLVAAFLMPMAGRGYTPYLSVFFESSAWRTAGPILLLLLALLGYGVAAAFSLRRWADPGGLCAALSIEGRVLFYGFPLSALACYLLSGPDGGLPAVASVTLKMACLFYGHILLAVVGAAAWLELTLRPARRLAPRPTS